MKMMRISTFAAPILGLLTGSVLVYASADRVVPPGGATITATTDTGQVIPAPVAAPSLQPVVAIGEDIVSPSWTKISDCNYDSRSRFFTGLQEMEVKADAQILELDAKRRTIPSTVDTKDWDFQMKEMVDARAYLKDMDGEIHKANSDTWDAQKERVGFAWNRLQDAYAKVKASTTY